MEYWAVVWAMAASAGASSTRLRGKCAPGGVASALELERRCGYRLRQLRLVETVLGVFDVMRLASEEFGDWR